MFKMSDALNREVSGFLDTYQVAHFVQHATDLWAVVVFHGLVELAKAQGGNNFLLLPSALDGAADLGDFELGHFRFNSR